MTVLETVVIPFNYIPINGGGWIRTAEPEGTVLQTVAFSQTSLLLHKWRGTESNRRHTELQSVALPTELPSHPCGRNYSVAMEDTGLEPVTLCL